MLIALLMLLPQLLQAQTHLDTLETAVAQANGRCEIATANVALAGWLQRNQQVDRSIPIYRAVFDDAACARPTCDASQDLSYLYSNRLQFDSALWFAKESVTLGEAAGDSAELAYSWEKLALAHHFLDQYQEAIPAYRQAITRYKELKNWRKHSGMSTNLALVYVSIAWYDKALEVALVALETPSSDVDAPELQAEASNGVAWVLLQTKDYAQSLEFSASARDYYVREDHPWGMANTFGLRGDCFLALHQTDSAEHYYTLLYQLRQKEQNDIRLAQCLLSLGRIAKRKNDLPTAQQRIGQAIQLLEQEQARIDLALAQLMLAEVLMLQHAPDSALQLLDAVYPIFESEGRLADLKTTVDVLARAHILLGNPEAANRYHQQTSALQDSIFEVDKLQAVANMRVRYNTEQREREVAEQKAINQQQRQLIWVTGIGLLLLLALVIAIAFGYRNKQRSNRLLATQRNALEQSDKDKALLLKEIHHRVKNNLQVISSLLYLQSRNINDPVALEAVKEGQNRVQSISLIHQKLYQTEDLGAITVNEYLPQLIKHLQTTFGTSTVDVQLSIEPADTSLDIDTAVPFALMVNELVTNAFKYGQPADGEGQINIQLEPGKDNGYRLTISDNGPGLPTDFDLKKTRSLGMRLVRELCKQLRGSLQFESKNGARFTVDFWDTAVRKTVD